MLKTIKLAKAKECFCRFRSVCGTDDGQSRSDGNTERSSGRTQVVFVSPRCSGKQMEKQFNSSGIISQVFHHCLLQKDLMRMNFQPGEFNGRIILSQCSMTLFGKRMMIICFECRERQELREIPRRTLDILEFWAGRSVVEVQKSQER